MNDQPLAELLLNALPAGADLIADKEYDADWIKDLIEEQDCTPHIVQNQIDTTASATAMPNTRSVT